MLTRRQWLQINPRPKSPVNLQALLDQEQHAASEQQTQLSPLYAQVTVANQAGKAAEVVALNTEIGRIKARQNETNKNITQLNAEIARSVKCPLHQTGLHYHRNRVEDLYLCENGPHFLFWTTVGGKPQLIPVPTLALPGIDYPMTEGTKTSRVEWLTLHQPPTSPFCPVHKEQKLRMEAPDLWQCPLEGEKYLWTKTAQGAAFIPWTAELPALDQPID
jgi:hypothetical protein